MLEHVEDFDSIIAQVAKRLKPNGLLVTSTINRTMKAYLLAIVGAEYLMRLLPKQTHDYQKFIRPSELAASFRQHGLELTQSSGLSYNPISASGHLNEDLSVNYCLAARKAVLD